MRYTWGAAVELIILYNNFAHDNENSYDTLIKKLQIWVLCLVVFQLLYMLYDHLRTVIPGIGGFMVVMGVYDQYLPFS